MIQRTASFIFAWILLAAGVADADQPHRFDGYKIVRVNVASVAELELLEASSAAILNCVPGVGPMEAVVSPEQLEALRAENLPLVVLHDDAQALIDQERQARETAVAGADPFDDFFDNYQPWGSVTQAGTILWYMDQLVTRYPELASFVDIGTTLEGRTIWGLRITSETGFDKPAVVYFGCEHAREWIACTVPLFFANHLLESYGLDATVTDLVDGVEFFLIPVFNIDGYIYSWTSHRYWRKNRRFNGVDSNGNDVYGVDINRNWAEGWGGSGSSGFTSSETYRGPSAFSEPETAALRDFFLDRPNIRAQLDIHSFGELILWPYGYTPALPPDNGIYQQIGSAMRSLILAVHGVDYDGVGPLYTTLYPASGVSIDWTYGELGILSYTFELRPDTGGGLPSFLLDPRQIIPTNEEVLPAMLHLANVDWVRVPLIFEFAQAVPETLTAGSDTPVSFELSLRFGSVLPESVFLHYRYHPDDPFTSVPMMIAEGESYEGALPATNCGSRPEFFFSVGSSSGETITNPADAPGRVYSADVRTEPGICFTPPGDFEGDGFVDMSDLHLLQSCFTAGLLVPSPGCRAFDIDDDGDIDMDDWSQIVPEVTGPSAAP